MVGLGGAGGAVLRYLFKLGWPGIWSTALINIVGCFLIGLLITFLQKSSPAYLLLIIGVLGGFTTFSSFALDAIKPTINFYYIILSTIGGLTACFMGLALGKLWLN